MYIGLALTITIVTLSVAQFGLGLTLFFFTSGARLPTPPQNCGAPHYTDIDRERSIGLTRDLGLTRAIHVCMCVCVTPHNDCG